MHTRRGAQRSELKSARSPKLGIPSQRSFTTRPSRRRQAQHHGDNPLSRSGRANFKRMDIYLCSRMARHGVTCAADVGAKMLRRFERCLETKAHTWTR